MTREQMILLDDLRVWHLEEFRKNFDSRLRARQNKDWFRQKEEHHGRATRLLAAVLAELEVK